MEKAIIFSDGGARGNPGPAGIGVIIYNVGGKLLIKKGNFIGEATNNQAEYRAVILGLEQARKIGAKKIIFRLDSELVVKQLSGQYKVKDAQLKPLFAKILALSNSFQKLDFTNIPREKNKLADRLVNEAIDRG